MRQGTTDPSGDVDPAEARPPQHGWSPPSLLVRSGPAWIVVAIGYAWMGREVGAAVLGCTGVAILALGLWARARPTARQHAWNLGVAAGAVALAAIAMVSGGSQSMAVWFLVAALPAVAYKATFRPAIRWALGFSGALLAVHVGAWLFPSEPEFVAGGAELFVAQLSMVALVLGFGVLARRDTDLGARELAEANARLRALADNIEVGISVTDTAGKIVLINPTARAMLGVSDRAEEDLVGLRAVDLFRARMEALGVDSTDLVAEMSALTAGGRKTLGAELDLPGGVAYERDYFPIRLEGGALGHMWAFRDISESKAVERLKDQFLSTISHELRTPLTKIQGSLKLVEAQVTGEVPGKMLELLRIAGTHSSHLDKLIGDLLDLQQIDAGNLKLQTELSGLAAMIGEAADGVRADADRARVELVVQAPCDVVVKGDAERLTQVFAILLSNAVKFSPDGGVVRVGVSVADGAVRVSISDEGPGIPADGLSQVFERFRQLDASDSRPKGGAGLGLAIARALVEAHGGRIGVESHDGAGATFWVEVVGERAAQPAPQRPA